MNKEEFIGKLEMVYVGDRNAFNEIVEDNQKLKNEVVYSKVEIDRLNNIIDGLEKWLEDNLGNCRTNQNYTSNQIYNLKEDAYYRCLNRLKELKENK